MAEQGGPRLRVVTGRLVGAKTDRHPGVSERAERHHARSELKVRNRIVGDERIYGERLNLCVWNKSNAGMGSLYRSKQELIFVYKVGDAPHLNNVELGRHGRNRTNVWDYASVNSMAGSRRDDLELHPTVKPTRLVADAIQDVTRRGELVLDTFLGSGTSLIAAERGWAPLSGPV